MRLRDIFEDRYISLDEYGGWIDHSTKQINYVNVESHYEWVMDRYGTDQYITAFQNGDVRFLSYQYPPSLNLQGTYEGLKNLFRIWFKSLKNYDNLYIDCLMNDSWKKFGFDVRTERPTIIKLFGPNGDLTGFDQ